jgi:hypothetical protein
MAIDLEIFIEGERIAPDRVANWERGSAAKALRKLRAPSESQDLQLLRRKLLERKHGLGHDGIRSLLRHELALSDMAARLIAWLSRGRRRYCVIEIVSPAGTAAEFANWFAEVARLDREDVMIAALPEHYLIATDAAGRQEVIETNGGAPMAARFFVDYADLSSLRSKADSEYPVQVAGVARAPNGAAIGGVRHQFRNEGAGFRSKLTVEFPLLIMPSVVTGHRWHLACEFSNWIHAAISELHLGYAK